METTWYNTKVIVEIDMTTQFGPETAVSAIKNLLQFPVVKSCKVIGLETDYKAITQFDSNLKVMGKDKLPIELK